MRRRLEQTTAGLWRLRNRELRPQLQTEHDLRVQGLTRLDEQLHQLDTELAALPSPQQIAQPAGPAPSADLPAALDRLSHNRRLRPQPPAHLIGALGPPPSDPRRRTRWDQAALSIEEHQLRWNITDAHRALGPEPADSLQIDERRSVAVTSNLHPSGFDTIMPKTLATATVDRLLHHAHVVLTEGNSHRLAQATAGRGVMPLT